MGKASATKQAMVVVGALACAWFAIELALKPFLDKTRSAIDKSDPTRDPDDDLETKGDPSTESPPEKDGPDDV